MQPSKTHHDLQETYVRSNGSMGVRTVNLEPPLTQQSSADDADINIMIARYQSTRDPIHLRMRENAKAGVYADLTELGDYQSMLHKVMEADALFNDLPAKVRERFRNNPSELITFIQDPNNRKEAIDLGLISTPIANDDPTTIAQAPIKKPSKKAPSKEVPETEVPETSDGE